MKIYEKLTLSLFFLVTGILIVGSAYLGINGHHDFRQADVYGHILGILGERGFQPFDLFSAREPWGEKAVFDLPVYQYLIAYFSKLFNQDPLVSVRYVNLFLWMITAFFGYRLCENMGHRFSGLIFTALFASSPLFIHYFSVPLPDNLAIALSVMATAILLRYKESWLGFAFAFPLLVIASAIKSPVAFVFIVFLTSYIFLSSSAEQYNFIYFLRKHASLIIFLICCLLATTALEIYRGRLLSGINGQNHIWGWYFGSLPLRLSHDFWQTLINRFNLWVPPYFLYAYMAISVISAVKYPSMKVMAVVISALLAFFSGWLIFSNVYMIHDYYEMPVAIIMFVSVAVSASQLIERNIKNKHLADKMTIIVPVLTLMIFFYQLASQDSYSTKYRADFWKTVEYSLRNDLVFLFVSNKEKNPAIGGRVSTKFVVIDPKEFESNCDDYIEKYSSILVDNADSKCLESAKEFATHYFADEGKIFIRTRKVKRGGDN
jgi:4-amino-4-deoxy-L-arabinose transferase-like glycosyltransferase